MLTNQVVSKEAWLEARRTHLAKEKEFTKLRDQLSQERRELPWVKTDQEYLFEGSNGTERLADLFNGRSQLIVYHFMYGDDWEEGCPSCSFWADNFNGIAAHLNHRDITFVAISTAKLNKLNAYKKRMGWTFNWVSSFGSDFNHDYQVTSTPEEIEQGDVFYNFGTSSFNGEERPGISIFYKNEAEEIFHTYSCYARGLDMLNGAYHYMDLTPKGRDEAELPWPMAWLRRHDQYES